MKKKNTIKPAKMKPRKFESNTPKFRKPKKVKTGDGHHLDSTRETAEQKTGGTMVRKKIKNIGRKTLSSIGTIVGAATGISVGAGQPLTGDVIFDMTVLVACLVIVLINGKDGVPDWMINLLKTRNKK